MLIALILIPVVVAILVGFGAPSRTSAVTGAGLTLLMTLWAMQMDLVNPGSSAFTLSGDFTSHAQAFQLGFAFHDGMSQVMALLCSIVMLAAVLGVDAGHPGARLKFVSVLLMGAGAMGAFLATDLIFLFAFHELALIPTFLMIGMFGRGDRRTVAWKTTLYLATASIVLLAGLIMVCQHFGTTSIAGILSSAEVAPFTGAYANVSAILIFIGLGTLVALFPFHSWAAPAYASAPAPVAMMHAGVLKKFGLFALIRLLPVFGVGMEGGAFTQLSNILLVLLVCNVIWVGYVTINQRRLDLMLGNSSVMHMGYIYLAIAAMITSGQGSIPELPYKAAVTLMFAHGLSVALLFYLAGTVERRTGTLEYASLGGLGKAMPALAFLFGIGAMASIGLPGLANFPGELMVFLSGFNNWTPDQTAMGPLQWATIACLWGLVIGAVYMLRAYRQVFQGGESAASQRAGALTAADRIPAIFLIVVMIAVGCWPNLILKML